MNRYIALEKIIELGSFTKAADALGYTQSSVSQMIASLESELGFKLLASTTGGKHGGGAALTPEGQALLSAYDQFCAELREYGNKLFAEKFGEFLN